MPKIIVVDDDPTNVTLTQMLLEMEGFTAIACTNLAQTHAAAQGGADAFVVDVNLARGESGLDFLREVRAGKTAVPPKTIVIVTSGDHRRRKEAMELGASRFLLKPYSPETLPTLINTFLSGENYG